MEESPTGAGSGAAGKPRGHRSEGDEEFEAARRRTQKKGHKKKSAEPMVGPVLCPCRCVC